MRLLLFASVIALGMGAALFHSSGYSSLGPVNPDIRRNTDGAFRDGLFIGKRAAEDGVAPHAPIGRWATEADRASFKAGYMRGYEEVLRSRRSSGTDSDILKKSRAHSEYEGPRGPTL
jgi:hypothetical protein